MRGEAFPYVRSAPEGVCELRHRTADVLAEITIRPSEEVVVRTATKKTRRWTMRRVVWACPCHAGGNGTPVTTPNTTTLCGTTALRPQELRLFDHVPYRKAGEAERRWFS